MPADINIWALAGTGFAAGLVGSMLGVGGGILIVPILTLLLGVPMQYAVGSSLASIVINACTATGVYIRSHMTNLKLGLLLSCTLIPGAVIGAWLAARLSSPILSGIFGLLLIYVAYTLIPHKLKRFTAEELERQKDPHEEEHASHAWLDGEYFDPAVDQQISYGVHRPGTGLTTGFFAGVISSMLGVGGGIINVPVMNLVMKVPAKAAIATSAMLLAFTTMTGALIYAYNGYIIPYVIAPLMISVFLGSRTGATLSQRLRSNTLMAIFAAFLVLTAVMMILRAFKVI